MRASACSRRSRQEGSVMELSGEEGNAVGRAPLRTRRQNCHIIGRAKTRARELTMPNARPRISFIGFGEAGQAIAAGLRDEGVERMAAWDILFPHSAGERLRPSRSADRRALRDFGRRRGSERGYRHLRRHCGVERGSGAVDQAAPCRNALCARHQLGLARTQATDREASRRHRPLCRRRRAGADISGAA